MSMIYPPVFTHSVMPAFVYTQNCRVYFNLSAYNSQTDFKKTGANLDYVQVTVRSQHNNKNVLSTTTYPAGVKICRAYYDNSRITDDKYYITISSNEIEEGFKLNQYYKIQIRLTENNINVTYFNQDAIVQNSNVVNAWINNNLEYFSEWSKVVLIRSISQPSVVINHFKSGEVTTLTNISNLNINGKLIFASANDTQELDKFKINIFDFETNDLIETSDWIYTGSNININEIHYDAKTNFQMNHAFYFVVSIVTKNGFELTTIGYRFYLMTDQQIKADIVLMATPDEDNGRVIISIKDNQGNPQNKNIQLIIRRISSDQDFHQSEIIYILKEAQTNENEAFEYTLFDTTIKFGTWYYYSVQRREDDKYSNITQTGKPIIVMSQDIFLVAEGKQLGIRYNPQINNFVHTVSETMVQTLGSQYPFIRRNGNVNFRTFSLSGLITCFMDIDGNLLSASKQELFGKSTQLYQQYNINKNITPFNDSVYEQKFREKVINFLYSNNVKLYKSITEGNILVKLMNITLTPNNDLSRHIYSFSCTAYEIAECSQENYEKYNIQIKDLNEVNSNFIYEEESSSSSNVETTAIIHQNGTYNISDKNTVIVDVGLAFYDDYDLEAF